VPGFAPTSARQTLNRWIAHETGNAAREVTSAIKAYRFNEAAAAVYRFVWNIFCDWYLELAKPVLAGSDEPAKVETRAMTAWVRDEILKLLHPFMPFVTEELWSVTAVEGPVHDDLLALTRWPDHAGLEDETAAVEIGWVIDLVAAIRSVKAEMNIMATEIPLVLAGVSAVTATRAGRWADVIKRLARLSSLDIAASPPPGSVQLVVRGEVAALQLKGVIDFAAERLRLEKELARIVAEIARIDGKLANADFIRRAPAEVVEGERERREEAQARRGKIVEALERLQGAGLD